MADLRRQVLASAPRSRPDIPTPTETHSKSARRSISLGSIWRLIPARAQPESGRREGPCRVLRRDISQSPTPRAGPIVRSTARGTRGSTSIAYRHIETHWLDIEPDDLTATPRRSRRNRVLLPREDAHRRHSSRDRAHRVKSRGRASSTVRLDSMSRRIMGPARCSATSAWCGARTTPHLRAHLPGPERRTTWF